MAEIVAHKKIVISAEDRVTSVIAKTNQAFNQLEQHLSQLGMKFNSGASEQSSYKTALNSTKSTVGETDEAIRKLNHNIDRLSKSIGALSNKVPVIKPRADTSEAQRNVNKLTGATKKAGKAGRSLTKSFVFGSLISNGIQTATNSLIGFAKQGFSAALAGQQVAARWSELGMTKGQIKEVGAAVTDLKENTSMSGVAVANLVTRFYGLTGSANEAVALSKGVGSITDSLRLSTSQSDAFANGLTRIESAGKVTRQSLGRLERQAPGITAALQKASGMSKKSFYDLLDSGKMTADQFNQIMVRASKSYQKNADSWDHTTEGALNNIKRTWAVSWQTMMAPLAQNSGQGLNALSKSLQTLRPQFKQLGEAVAELATKFAKWLTPQHVKDLGEIVSSLGHMVVLIGKGAWDTFTGIAETVGKMFGVWGKSSDGLDNVANALEHISQNRIAVKVMEGVGSAIATYYVYSKLSNVAKALGDMYTSLKDIASLSVSKIAAVIAASQGNYSGNSKILQGVSNSRSFGKTVGPSGVLKQEEAEAGAAGDKAGQSFISRLIARIAQTRIGGKITYLFLGVDTAAGMAGTKSGGSFLSRFGAMLGGSQMLSIGRTMAGRVGAGITIGLSAIDLARGLTPSFKGDRLKMIGKGAGGLIGAGIGGYFGGPEGAAIGSMAGQALGGYLLKGIVGSLKDAYKLGYTLGELIQGKISFSTLTSKFKKAWSGMISWAGKEWDKFKRWWNNDDESSSSSSSHKSSSHKSKQPSEKEIKSLGGNHYSRTDIANIKQMNSAVRAYTQSLKELKAVVKKDDPTKQLRNMSNEFRKINPSIRESAKYWKGLAKPLEMSARAFKVVDKALSAFKRKNNPMDRLNSSVQKLTKTVKKEQFGKLLAKQMQIADKSMSGKHSFVGQFESMTKRVISQLSRFRRSFDSDWRNTWSKLDSYPSRGLSRTASIVSSRLNAVLNREHSFSHSFLSSWRSWTNDVVSAMRSGFGKLPDIAQHAMSGIVSRLNSGISAINAVISDFGGDKRLGSIHYAHGTFFHPGGKAVLNDGLTAHKQELVWEPSRGFSLPQGQNAVHDLERGAMVLDAPHTDPLLNRMGIPHYAEGTLSEDQQDQLAEEFIDNPIKASRDLVLKVTNWDPSVPVIADLGKATAIGFSRGIANVLKDLLGIIKEPINGDWTPVIKSAFRVLHIHPSAWMISKFLRQIQTESNGQETAIGGTDGLSDGRATGLLQFKPGTFAHWARAPYDHIMKGFDQIVTAIRVLMAGGEGGWSNFGMGHGWATGGEITSQQFGWVGDNAQHHEFVINPYNSNSLPLLTKAWTVMNANHPEWRTPTGSSYNATMIALMKAAVASINNIDIHPRVYVDDVRRPINNRDAMDYSRVMN